jgi:hypothetical protein
MSRQLQLLTHHKETKIPPWTPLIHAMANDFYKASSRRWIQEARGLTSFITALLWIGLLLLLVCLPTIFRMNHRSHMTRSRKEQFAN